MSRNRSIYADDFIYVGPTPATGKHFSGGNFGTNLVSGLYRVQSANYGKTVTRQDINQFGELARIDSIILESPTTSFDMQFLAYSAYNERLLGFTISSGTLVSAISGILNQTQDEKNYFIRMVGPGEDVVGNTVTPSTFGAVIGIGNGFITSYSAEGSVGALPTVSVNVEGLGWKVDTTTGQAIPAVNPVDGSAITTYNYALPAIASSNPSATTITALRPGDIVLDFGNFAGDEAGAQTSDMKIQSYSVSFDLSRTALNKLGSKFAFSREINFPVTTSMSITADVGDLQSGNFVDKVNADATYDLTVKIYRPATTTRTDQQVAVAYFAKGMKLDSENYSSSIGSNKSVTLNFTSQIGSLGSTGIGLFISGLN